MSNKMLIDASHPEETRVAVVRGNRVEEFDFESQEKKQLRGNIYLAKVTRVEPSLQAAFVDYGGNRHGFLAFSEIHPDYYQIPVADRQALLEAEAQEARAHREAEEQEDAEANEAEAAPTDSEEQDPPKKKPRRRRSRKAKDSDSEQDSSDPVENAQEASEASEKPTEASASEEALPAEVKEEIDEIIENVEVEAADPSSETEEKPKPKRRTTRRKPAAKKAKPEEETVADNDDTSDTKDDDDGGPTTMAAMVEMDSISEDLPDETGDDADASDNVEQPKEVEDKAEAEAEAEEKPKPKKRAPRRKPAAKKAKVEEEATAQDESKSEDVSNDADAVEADKAETEEAEEAPKKKPTRRRSPRSKKKTEEAKESASEDENDADSNNNGEAEVESVGQEDALEEVPNPRRQRRHYKIQEVIKRRQVLLVQVVKEERGNKGAALTTYLSLAGRYSVLMPNTARGGGISRKITNASDRKRLKSIASNLDVPSGMGVILRTAGASRTDTEINRDFEYLMRLWEQVRNLTLSSTAPCLVYEEGSLIKRSIRDLYDKDTNEIVVCGENGYKEARDFMEMLMPEHIKKVKHYRDSAAIFTKFGVETQLERMVSPQVTMKSGGYLVINQTEALVAVDVNSGRSTREHSIEDTALQTNLEAAEEVARQLRLRDLAGLIVIDFIDMEEKRNNRAVERRLKECLKNDRARIQVGRISHFGLLEMSRQRMRSSVLESTMDVCEHCAGLGYIRSDSAIALHVFRAIEEHVAKHNKFDAVVRTTRPIAFHILNHKRAALLELEARYGLQVIIEGDATISGQEFAIEKGEPASGEPPTVVVGFQNDAAFDALSSEEENDEGRKGNRRNRGRKNRDREDDDQNQETAKNETDSDDESDDDRPRRKRRRGKRGGRRRNNNENENGSSDENNETVADANNSGDQETSNEDTQPPEEEAKKPKRRTSRNRKKEEEQQPSVEAKEDATSAAPSVEEEKQEAPAKRRNRVTQKAPIQKKPEPKPESSSAENADAAKKEEPPRPARRRTTRRAPEASSVPVEEVIATPPTNETEQAQEAPAEKSESDEKPAKKGWWNRGGGFF